MHPFVRDAKGLKGVLSRQYGINGKLGGAPSDPKARSASPKRFARGLCSAERLVITKQVKS